MLIPDLVSATTPYCSEIKVVPLRFFKSRMSQAPVQLMVAEHRFLLESLFSPVFLRSAEWWALTGPLTGRQILKA
jgi:hypothetical protein